ncbi:MAG: NAD(P)/FAD-dependent oxidoreductase [Oligoflexales bacterium]
MTSFNTVVIGGGAAGLVSAYISAAVKAKVALVERDLMGGDCLNTGCVPSKALIKTAKFVHEMKRHQALGVKSVSYELDLKDIMDRVHQTIAKIAPHDSIERYTGLGVDCFQGQANILNSREVEVDGKVLKTKNIILAHGAAPFVPPIKGLDQVPYLTSENLWKIDQLPEKLIVLGGGPIGCELAQAFARLGSNVTQVEMMPSILIREDSDVSELIHRQLSEDGVNILADTKATEVEKRSDGTFLICEGKDKQQLSIPFDKILVAVGRKARTAGIAWEKLGVSLRPNGTIDVDPYLCANGSNIFAAGDVTGPYQFTHTASHQAYYASVNALFRPIKFKANYRVIPWVTYTDPEVAQVGLNEKEAKKQGVPCQVVKYGIDDLDRAITESEDHGFVKLLVDPSSSKGRILGATIVSHNAGELNTEFVAAMQHGFGLNQILGTVHPYPTMSEANKYAAGVWKRSQTKPWIMNLLSKFHGMRR